MRTPGHAVLNLLALSPTGQAAAAVAGAILPDVPIAILYVWERGVKKTPEEAIWTDAYQRPLWQALVNGCHSLPLTVAAAAGAWALHAPAACVLFVSMLLHALADIPVHADDAHRHLFPLSPVKWKSPLSYWDVRHHARVVAAVEALLVCVAAALLFPSLRTPGRVAVALVSAWYLHGYYRTFLKNGGRWQPYF